MFDRHPGLIDAIRDRFAHVDTCPVQGERVFFENAGGALTLGSVVETSTRYAAIPDNQGRDNPMSHDLMATIAKAKADMMTFLNASGGQIFMGESGTELLFRMISNAIIESAEGGIIHTSPVTGMAVDVAAVAAAIRAVSPDCYIIVDGIQHAAHGRLDLDSYGIDGYAISPYKMFSRHGFGIAWISDRLTALPHDSLMGGPEGNWELGTRDTGAYATLSDVVGYFEWLGGHFSDSDDSRTRLEAAGEAIHGHERALTDAMLNGTGNLKGLADMPEVRIIGGIDNPRREGLVACWIEGRETAQVVRALGERGIRVHIRKADHYSGNILDPLDRPDCIRVSLCHYNTLPEVAHFLTALREITETA